MNLKLFILASFVGLFLSLGVCGQEAEAEKIALEGCKLTNLYKIDEGVYRSEQPSSIDFKVLEEYGIGEILNLRNRHSDDDEAKGTGLTLHRVRTKAHAINEKQLIASLRIIYHRKRPVLIHCHHGSDRTGAVCALYRIVFQGFSKERAIEEMVRGGFGFHRIYQNIIRLIRQADIERIRKEVCSTDCTDTVSDL
ncbi:MAG: dual specificity protein phosphatase family protein [Bacteroides pyogenes]|nr:dual specificity protein phosphatase family protein [Bacteroides pyogenes]MCI7070948.1 dual specificity protein phosphatase family protein [Bacteroides pyogenes]